MTLTPKAASRKDAMGGEAAAFQHRHYAFVAKVIRDQDVTHSYALACTFADAFQRNPRFDRARFLKACGVE